MYKIGQFAEIVQTSIRTLRFYDKIDLFKPEEIDLFTNYRYYSKKQVEDFYLITKLKEVGFSLEEIKENWGNFNDKLLLQKKEELLQNKNSIDKQIKKLDRMRSVINKTKSVKVLRKE
ncbi:MAG: MerR family transcriptional regulator [Bacilli bacterium]|nr:MerR family transcriptional regulator [Bacilli bacterium]